MFKSYQSPGLLADETDLQALHKIADIKHETDSLFSIKLNMRALALPLFYSTFFS